MRFHQDTPANRSKITSKTPQPFPKIPGAKGIPPEQLRCSYIPRFHRRPPTPAGNDRQGSPGVHLEHAITGAAFRGCCDPRVINERRVISSDHRSVPHGAWPWGHRVVEGTGVQCPRELPPAFFSSPLHGNVGGGKRRKSNFFGGAALCDCIFWDLPSPAKTFPSSSSSSTPAVKRSAEYLGAINSRNFGFYTPVKYSCSRSIKVETTSIKN